MLFCSHFNRIIQLLANTKVLVVCSQRIIEWNEPSFDRPSSHCIIHHTHIHLYPSFFVNSYSLVTQPKELKVGVVENRRISKSKSRNGVCPTTPPLCSDLRYYLQFDLDIIKPRSWLPIMATLIQLEVKPRSCIDAWSAQVRTVLSMKYVLPRCSLTDRSCMTFLPERFASSL